MLILAPTAQHDRDGDSIAKTITERIEAFRRGDIKSLYDAAMQISSWSKPTPRPNRSGNRPAQAAADVDNLRSAIKLLEDDNGMAVANDNNIGSVEKLYPHPMPSRNLPDPSTGIF